MNAGESIWSPPKPYVAPTTPGAPSFPLDLAGNAAASSFQSGTAIGGAALPGYMTSMGNIGANIASATAGQVPDDVLALLQQQGAEGNVGTGRAGNSAYLRALGLTSLGLQDQGQKNFESILETLPGYGMSQNPVFQTTAPLAQENSLTQQLWGNQKQQQQIEIRERERALLEAKKGAGFDPTGMNWGAPQVNAWNPFVNEMGSAYRG